MDIINSTIGKALGVSQGGYTTGPKELIDLLRQRSKSFRYSQTIPPAVAAAGCVVKLLPYSRKIWRGVKFGGLADCLSNRQIKIHQTFLLAYICMAIPYRTAKLNPPIR